VCVPALSWNPEFCVSIPKEYGERDADPESFRAWQGLVCPCGAGPESPRDRTSDANISPTMGIIFAPACGSLGSPESCFPISGLFGKWDAEIPSTEFSLGSVGEGAGLACSGTGRESDPIFHQGPENGSPESCFPISDLHGKWDAEIPSTEFSLGSVGEGTGRGLRALAQRERVTPFSTKVRRMRAPAGTAQYPNCMGNGPFPLPRSPHGWEKAGGRWGSCSQAQRAG